MRRTFTSLFGWLLGQPKRKKIAVPHDALPMGSILGERYSLTGFIGNGGFGFTYIAEDTCGKKWAIKECFPREFCRRHGNSVGLVSQSAEEDFGRILAQFEVEAECIRELQHPNIVKGENIIFENNTAYIALEFIEGETLAERLSRRSRSLPKEDLLKVIDSISDAVNYVHRSGYLHKDISPDNVMLRSDGSPVLIDFGNTERIKGKVSEEEALLVIKEGYSPQEFYHDPKGVNKASDVYQLGATIYHCISGEKPPESVHRMFQTAIGKPDPLRRLSGRYPKFSADFLEKTDQSLAIFAQDRLQTLDGWTSKQAG